jgi:5-methylcytosine-specific restriction endonuclease McrA
VDTEGVVTSPIPSQPRLRLDRDSYRGLCQRVIQRDGWRCQRCGSSKDLQVHHIQPRSLLGGDVEENLVTLCSACHRQVHLGAEAASRPE